jgi:uncharacterized protein (DUF433 family)
MTTTGIDWSGCPIIQYDPEKLGGAPTIRAWRVTPDTIVENSDDGMTIEELREQFEIPIDDIRVILKYAVEARVGACPSR